MIALIFMFGILIGASGGILMKIGAGQLGHVELGSINQIIHFLFKILTNVPSIAGVSLYFVSMITWSYLLTKLDISFVQPILALTYVVTPVLAILFLHESVPPVRWIGILVIIVGVFIVARTA